MKTKSKKPWSSIHKETSTWARWVALYEAVNMIADEADNKKVSFKNKLKPIAISKYIEATQDMYLRKLVEQEYNVDFYFDDSLEKKSL